jgi:1,4-alpha-glucan branching enzyme
MSIHKQYLKSRPVCKVTFRIPEEFANTTSQAAIAGDFNGWSLSTHPMKKLKNGAFMAALDLEAGREYQFRYVLDQQTWENDAEADGYVPTPFGDGHNGVLIT